MMMHLSVLSVICNVMYTLTSNEDTLLSIETGNFIVSRKACTTMYNCTHVSCLVAYFIFLGCVDDFLCLS